MTTIEKHAADEARRAEIAKNEEAFRATQSNPLLHYDPPAEEPRALTLADFQANAEAGRLRSMSTAGGVQRELMRMAEKIAPPSTVSTAPEEVGMQLGAASQHALIHSLYGESCFNKMIACMRSSGQHIEASAAQTEVNEAVTIQALIDQNVLAPEPLPQFVRNKIALECLVIEGELLAECMGLKP